MNIIRSEASALKQGGYSILNNTYDRIYKNLKEFDDGFYRAEKTYDISSNDALVFETKSITFSGSTYSKETHKFLERLGIKSSHVHVIYNSDCTKAVDMLLGVKYIVSFPKHEASKDYIEEYVEDYFENKIKMLKNPYYLSFGYSVKKEIFETNMKNDNTFELQNEILKNMTGIEENVYKMHNGTINNKAQGLEQIGEIYKKKNDDAKIIYEFEIEKKDNAYIYIKAVSDENAKLYVNDEEMKNHESITENEMINLGKREIGEIIKIEIIPQGDIIINNFFVAYENEEILQKHYDILRKEQVNMEKIDGRRYKGTINIAEEEQYVLFTIPYEEGWKITVDEKEIIPEKVLDALISLNLDKGEHEIYFEYTPPKIYIGLMISLFGIIIFIAYILIDKRNKI